MRKCKEETVGKIDDRKKGYLLVHNLSNFRLHNQ
jgi:hypothetical protein